MLIPVDGHFECSEPKCDFATCDLFEYMEHCGVEYEWGVRLNKRYTFDLFQFLSILNNLTNVGDLDAMYDHVQSAVLLLVNASGDELEDFIEETVVQSEMSEVMEGLERLLKDNG
jgi:hypothetical protein